MVYFAVPANTRLRPSADLMFVHRLRHWPNISSTLGQSFLFLGTLTWSPDPSEREETRPCTVSKKTTPDQWSSNPGRMLDWCGSQALYQDLHMFSLKFNRYLKFGLVGRGLYIFNIIYLLIQTNIGTNYYIFLIVNIQWNSNLMIPKQYAIK